MKKLGNTVLGLLLTGLSVFVVITYIGPWLARTIGGLFGKATGGNPPTDTL